MEREIEKRFIIKCFAMTEDRVFSHLSMTAEERYDLYFEQHKELFNQVPLQYIASVLGMTAETFSRIKKADRQKVLDICQALLEISFEICSVTKINSVAMTKKMTTLIKTLEELGNFIIDCSVLSIGLSVVDFSCSYFTPRFIHDWICSKYKCWCLDL